MISYSAVASAAHEWTTTGRDPAVVKPLERALERHDEIGREWSRLQAAAASAYKDVAERIVAGSVSFTDGLAQYVEAKYFDQSGSGSTARYGPALGSTAQNLALKRGVQEFRRIGGKEAEDLLRRRGLLK